MPVLDQPTYCSPQWDQLQVLSQSYASSEEITGLGALSHSPLRRYQLKGVQASELSDVKTLKFLGQLRVHLQDALPIRATRIERTREGEFLILAVIDRDPSSEVAVAGLDEVYPWFCEHAPDEQFLLDLRRQ